MDNKSFVGTKSNTTQAFWVGLGSLSSFGLALLSAAILSRYLDKDEYGTYRQILFVYNTLLVIFSAGLPRVFSYYLPRYNLAQGKEIVFKISRVLFLTGFLFSVVLYLLSGVFADILKNPELSRGLKFFSPVPFLLLPTLGIQGIFSTYKRTVYIALYNILSRILMLVIIVGPVIFFSGNYITALYGWIVSSFVILVLAYYFKAIPFRGLSQEKSGLGFREILTYSLPLVSASIAGIVYRSANQFFISRYFGPEVFAEFSNGFIEIPFVRMITGATATVLMPVFSKHIHENSDVSKIGSQWQSAIRKSAVLIYPIVVFLLFYSKELVTMVFSEAYSVSSKYFSIAMILNFFNIIVLAPILLAMGESKFYARLHYVMAIATWLIEYIVLKIFNTPISIAISFVSVSAAGAILPLFYISNKLKISFFTLFPLGRFLIVAAHSFLSMFLVDLLVKNLLPDSTRILVVSVAGTGYLVLLLITSKLFRINYMEMIRPLLKRSRKDQSESHE